jgi:protein gp37
MGENSGIQWTTHTFNPWVGCQRVSPGCEHCYAEAYDKRVGGAKLPNGTKALRWGPTAPRVRTSPANWRKPIAWNKAAAEAGRRDRVFCASLADVFEDRPELASWRLELLELIRTTPDLDWLLLTKRPANVLPSLRAARYSIPSSTPLDTWLVNWMDFGHPPANVWLGTTVEDQRRADERIPALVEVPAVVRFLSCEPLLERVDLHRWLDEDATGFVGLIGWVIIGGESGPGARPFAIEWARAIIRQCRDGGRAEAAPFVKQLGARPVAPVNEGGGVVLGSELVPARMKLADPSGGDPAEWPEDLRVREFPWVPASTS